MLTTVKSMRIVVLACKGRYQHDLVVNLARSFDVAGVVWHAPVQPKGGLSSRIRRYVNPLKLAQHLVARHSMRSNAEAARPLLDQLFPAIDPVSVIPGSPMIEVENVNAPAAVDMVRELRPDVVCINGTNLLREPMLALAPAIRHGFVNLHTGLSPYSRGGNCDLFMLLEGKPEYVGVTIHFIDKGIDSGDIILTARPALTVQDNYEMIEAKAFRLGNDLMVRAVQQLALGQAQRVPQWQEGKLFLRRTGYVYEPRHRLLVNRKLSNGLVAEYLRHQSERDRDIRLIGDSR
jgi:methionyl-tRNA formyltransferase